MAGSAGEIDAAGGGAAPAPRNRMDRFIDGIEQPLESRHIRLYEQFKDRP